MRTKFTIEMNAGADHLEWRLGQSGTVEIYDMGVTSERRKGTGRAMIEQLKQIVPDDVKTIYLFTRENNDVAHRFYEAVGFKIWAQLPGFYADGDARMYGLKL